MSLAYMSPTYQDTVYGQPKEVQVTLLQGEGWGPKVAVPNSTVKIYGADKMDWRGECFLISGMFCVVGPSAIYFQICLTGLGHEVDLKNLTKMDSSGLILEML